MVFCECFDDFLTESLFQVSVEGCTPGYPESEDS